MHTHALMHTHTYTFLGNLSLWMSLSLAVINLISTCCFNRMSMAYLRIRTCSLYNFSDLEYSLKQDSSPDSSTFHLVCISSY